ncbi:MAG: cell wall hydrolase [Bacteroidales bacterium]|nr:cell wall hydrolase [Bacteroidales bacterium]
MRNSSKISKNRCSHKGTKTLVITSALLITSLTGCRKTEQDTGQHPTSKEMVVCTMSTTPIVPITTPTTTTQNTTTSTKVTTSKSTTEVIYRNTTKTKPSVIIYNATQLGAATNKPIAKTTKIETTITESVVTECVTTIPTEEYVVYKPSTYYIHKNTCRWADNTTYKILNTNNIEARKCTECNPHMEIVTEYIPPIPENRLPITETERILLCNLVGREYGSDWVSVYEKAKVVATVINRVNDPNFPNTIYVVITQPNQFEGYIPNYSYTYQVTDSVIEAVDYYFAHPEEFENYKYFYGDGTWNYFY